MTPQEKEKYLKPTLRICGATFMLLYPISFIWPPGFVWHGGQGFYYFQMLSGVYVVLGIYLIRAASKPSEHRSLISFTVWSTAVHGSIMAVQAVVDTSEHAHLMADVPATLLVAGVLGYFSSGAVATEAQRDTNHQ